MEPRERYQPEDIEALLHERGFDELLDEERAFVLRHLSGRDEYEAMRSLLQHTHDDRTHTATVEAEPHVRAHLMDVFRAEQRPQWRIWLNGVGAWLLPRNLGGIWRPALAFGTVVAAVWFTVRESMPVLEPRQQLAEVKVQEAAKPATGTPEPITTPTPAQVETHQAAGADEAGTASSNMKSITADNDGSQNAAVAKATPPPTPAIVTVNQEQLSNEVAADAAVAEDHDRRANAMDSAITSSGATGHEVTEKELARNMSVAGVSEEQVRTKEEDMGKRGSRARTVSASKQKVDQGNAASTEASAYVGMLRAAW